MVPQIEIPQSTLLPVEAKRMLGVTWIFDADDKPTSCRVYINYSSLDVIQTCMRKAFFSLREGYTRDAPNPATMFGTGIHKALEVYYCSPIENRKKSSLECDEYQVHLLRNEFLPGHGSCARCAAVFAFLEATKSLAQLPDLGARSQGNGLEILNAYCDHYKDDPYELVRDSDGPICERTFELPLRGDTLFFGGREFPIEIVLFGTIDSILQDKITGEIIVCDHKTTSALGKDFFNRIAPNFQYTMYFYGAKEVLKLQPKRFMVNGIQVAKTKQAFERQFTYITQDAIDEMLLALRHNVCRYMQAILSDSWPQSTPNSCAMWGGCTYRQVCELPKALQQNVLEAHYVRGNKNEVKPDRF